MYEEYEQKKFIVDGYEGIIICPDAPRADKKYIWRTEFLGAFDWADREMLRRGWYLVYYKISDRFGEPNAVKSMRNFQAYLEQKFELAEKAVLFGFSRGGLYAVNYAAEYPDKVAKIYLDAPVLDVFSWPGGFWRGEGSPTDWEMCRKYYHIQDGENDTTENPIKKIGTLIQNRIPVLLVAGDADTVVPLQENGALLYAEYMYAGAPIKMIVKPGVGHHPHSLEQPEEIADWISFDEEYGCIIDEGAQDWQIFQQDEDGYAKICLCGRCVSRFNRKSFNAFIRIVNEADGMPVLNWCKCETENNHWKAELRVRRGGTYRIETCMDESEKCHNFSVRGDVIHHIGVGDVYVIAGQSNAAGYGKDYITDLPEQGVHLLKNNGKWDIASHPMNDSTATVHPQNRDNANTGQSPYLSFGKYLKRELGYPIGLVQTAQGASSINAWSAPYGYLYQNMIKVVKGLNGIKGILWYQGCTEAGSNECEAYFESFKQMVKDMRRELDSAELPFLTCQLHKMTANNSGDTDCRWGKIREAQRRAAKEIPNVFVIPTWGGMMSDHIHNAASSNLVIGERLAKCALGHLYGRDIFCDAPDIVRAVRNGKILRLEFTNIGGELEWISKRASGEIFVVEKDGKLYAPVSCEVISSDAVELKFDSELPKGCVVHGGYKADLPYQPLIDNASRLPMLSFYGVKTEQ